jgi:hypothetical protein
MLFMVALATLATSELAALTMRPITVRDCVETRRVVDREVQISPDGSRVAYVLKSPDVLSNRNRYQLGIRDLRRLHVRDNGHLLLQADKISGIRWLNSREIVLRVERKSKSTGSVVSQVIIVDSVTGAMEGLRFPGLSAGAILGHITPRPRRDAAEEN